MKIFKFGGSSLGSSERLLWVTECVSRARSKGPLAVVVSAMGDTTDALIAAAHSAAAGDGLRAHTVLDVAIDRCTSTALLAAAQVGAEARVAPLVRTHFAPLHELLNAIVLLRECSPQTLDLVLSYGEVLSARVLAELLDGRGTPALFVDSRDWTVTDETFGSAVVAAE